MFLMTMLSTMEAWNLMSFFHWNFPNRFRMRSWNYYALLELYIVVSVCESMFDFDQMCSCAFDMQAYGISVVLLQQETHNIPASFLLSQMETTASSKHTSSCKWLLIHIWTDLRETGLPASLVVSCLTAWSWDVRSEWRALLPSHWRSNTHQAAWGWQTVKTEPDLGGNYRCLLNLWNVLSKTWVTDTDWHSCLSRGGNGDYYSLGLHSLVFRDVGGWKV